MEKRILIVKERHIMWSCSSLPTSYHSGAVPVSPPRLQIASARTGDEEKIWSVGWCRNGINAFKYSRPWWNSACMEKESPRRILMRSCCLNQNSYFISINVTNLGMWINLPETRRLDFGNLHLKFEDLNDLPLRLPRMWLYRIPV